MLCLLFGCFQASYEHSTHWANCCWEITPRMALMSIVFLKTRYNFYFLGQGSIPSAVPLQNKKSGHYQMITVFGKLWKSAEQRAFNLSALGFKCTWPYGQQPWGQNRIHRGNYLRNITKHFKKCRLCGMAMIQILLQSRALNQGKYKDDQIDTVEPFLSLFPSLFLS